jgi:hypothetical protein
VAESWEAHLVVVVSSRQGPFGFWIAAETDSRRLVCAQVMRLLVAREAV